MKLRGKRERIYMCVIIGFTLLGILPLLQLSFYNHPSADDYMYATNTYQVWNETHSLWLVLKEAVVTSAEFYQNWQGLYASAFILALQPAIFGEGYYALTGFLMLGILYGGNLFFADYVLHKRLQCSRLESITCGCIVSFVMVQWMPSVVQGLYWFNGTMNYVLFFVVLQVFVCGLMQLQIEEGKVRNTRNTVFSIVLGVLLAGGNHITAFMGILVAVAMTGISAFCKQRGFMLRSVVALIAIVSGFLFNVSSPGTQIRQSNFSNTPGVANTIWYAIKSGLKMIDQWMGLAVLISFLLVVPIALNVGRRICEKTDFRFRYPLVVLICSVGWCCAMLCPPIYAMGTTGDLRITNVVYFSFVLLLFINGFYLCGWYAAWQFRRGAGVPVMEISRSWCLTTMVLLVGLLLACGENMSSYQAFVEIRSGEAKQYSIEADSRYDILKNSKGEDVVLQPFTAQPYLVFFDDITENPSDWRNQYMKSYFELNSVILKTAE